MIRLLCAKCNKALKVADKFAGRKAKCPGCRNVFVIRADDALQGEQPDDEFEDVILHALTDNLIATFAAALVFASLAFCWLPPVRVPALVFGILAVILGLFGMSVAAKLHGAGRTGSRLAIFVGLLTTAALGVNLTGVLRAVQKIAPAEAPANAVTNTSTVQPFWCRHRRPRTHRPRVPLAATFRLRATIARMAPTSNRTRAADHTVTEC